MKLNFRDNGGAALVELALTTPLFLIMILGETELGRMAYYGIEVENAARAGASYGAVNMGNALITLPFSRRPRTTRRTCRAWWPRPAPAKPLTPQPALRRTIRQSGR